MVPHWCELLRSFQVQSDFQLIGLRSFIVSIGDVTIFIKTFSYVKLVQKVDQYWLELLIPIEQEQAFKVHFLHFGDFYGY